MSMDLAKKTFTQTPEYLIAGTTIRITTAIKEAASALKTGAVVKIDGNGKAEHRYRHLRYCGRRCGTGRGCGYLPHRRVL